MIKAPMTLLQICVAIYILALPQLLFSAVQEKPEQLTYTPLSFAISGGISLGAYEAGLNWAIVKYSKAVRHKPSLSIDNKPPKLVSVTGASAGGINALVTAISWCIDEQRYNQKYLKKGETAFDSVSRNLFKDIWMDVGFDSLLPVDSQLYLKDDALFTRNAFAKVIQNIKNILSQDVFIEGCKVPVAVTTTRTTPVKEEIIKGIEVENQRFVVPFILATAEDGSRQLNILPYEQDKNSTDNKENKQFGNVLHLPYATVAQKKLKVQDVIDAVLASSAFPVAFGRISLNYCLHNEKITDKSKINTSKLCSQNHSLMQDEFVDGGVFDNVPLGLAKLVAGDNGKQNETYHYVYLDPSSRRLASDEKRKSIADQKKDTRAAYGLSNQLSFLGGAISTAESYELYNVLRSGDWENDRARKIILSSRYPAITGIYLGHFGAFLDDGFRRYDYYAGVYDAVHDLAAYRCRFHAEDTPQYKACLGQAGKIIFDELKITNDKDASAIFSILASSEHGRDTNDTSWQWAYKNPTLPQNSIKSNAQVVAQSLVKLRTTDGEEPDFSKFITTIADDYNQAEASAELKRIIRNKNASTATWFYPLASRISLRLFNLEKADKTSSFEGILGMTAFGIESALGDKKKFEWNQSTALNSNYRIIPYEISAGIGATGMNLSWESRYRLSDANDWNLRIKYSPFASVTDEDKRIWFSQIDMSISKSISSMLMVGAGPTISRSNKKFAGFEQRVTGAAVYLSLTDKLRFTYGRRSLDEDFAGGDRYFYISITDLPGFVYWIKQSF